MIFSVTRRWLLLPLVLFCLFLSAEARADEVPPPVIAAGDPWARQILQFIGGPYVTVEALENWNSSWRMVRDRRAGKNALVTIVLNHGQARRLRLTSKNGTVLPNVRLLFDTMPLEQQQEERFYLDPSQLPFIAQRSLVLLAQLWPHRYVFFQRRLAEFETRLRSTVLTGRSLLSGLTVWDSSGGLVMLLRAAGCEVPLTPQEVVENLEAWMPRNATSRRNVDTLPWEGKVVLLDWNIAPALRNRLAGQRGVVEVPPFDGSDILLQIHQFYLDIAQVARMTDK